MNDTRTGEQKRITTGMSTMLPLDARKRLAAAADAPPRERTRAIEEAIGRVKLQYPKFFRS